MHERLFAPKAPSLARLSLRLPREQAVAELSALVAEDKSLRVGVFECLAEDKLFVRKVRSRRRCAIPCAGRLHAK
jgi:hypothetical protein